MKMNKVDIVHTHLFTFINLESNEFENGALWSIEVFPHETQHDFEHSGAWRCIEEYSGALWSTYWSTADHCFSK